MIGKILCNLGSHRQEVRRFEAFAGVYCSRKHCGKHIAGMREEEANARIEELVGRSRRKLADLVASAEFEGGTPSKRAQYLASDVLTGEVTGDEAVAAYIEEQRND